jgi:hypothetical protein
VQNTEQLFIPDRFIIAQIRIAFAYVQPSVFPINDGKKPMSNQVAGSRTIQDDISYTDIHLLLYRAESTKVALANERKHAAAPGSNLHPSILVDHPLHGQKQGAVNLLFQ